MVSHTVLHILHIVNHPQVESVGLWKRVTGEPQGFLGKIGEPFGKLGKIRGITSPPAPLKNPIKHVCQDFSGSSNPKCKFSRGRGVNLANDVFSPHIGSQQRRLMTNEKHNKIIGNTTQGQTENKKTRKQASKSISRR